MATSNRTAIFAKTHKVLKKQYSPVKPAVERNTLEQLIYASCLANAHYEKADEAYARLEEMFFDWNEIRVSTVTEIAEVVKNLPHPARAASNIRRILQSVFESLFSFDLEPLKKQNIGVAVKTLVAYQGASQFAISYVIQHAFGGHSIPIDKGAFQLFLVLGVAEQTKAGKQTVPGLERAIAKAKGIEFGSLLHQWAADYHASVFSPKARAIVAEIDPKAKARLPKRGSKKKAAAKTAKKEAGAERKKSAGAAEKKVAKPAEKKKAPAKKKAAKSAKKPSTTRKKTADTSPKPKAAAAKKKSTTRRLAKQKPR